MGIAIVAPGKDVETWKEIFASKAPEINVQVYPDIEDYKDVEAVILWQHPHRIWEQLPNLKLICSMGAGVDHILQDPGIPKGLPITRIVDDGLTQPMTRWVLMAILNHQRQFYRFEKNRASSLWDMSNPELDITVGVMGVGALGRDVLEKVQSLGIPVIGYGRSRKTDFPFPYFREDELSGFQKKANVIVCMLPLTEETEGILNLRFFKNCSPGTYLINAARGKHLVEEDLLEALDKGWISGAFLDVFQTEPLPESHPFWKHEKIHMTPHIASVTNPESAIPQIIENYNRIQNMQALVNQIDRTLNY